MNIDPRSQMHKDRMLTAPYEICIERARYYTESYRRTEGEPPAIRAAKALAHTLAKMNLFILEEERIIGNRCGKLGGAIVPVERGDFNTVLELELDFLLGRESQPYRIAPEDRRELEEEILPYWRGRTFRDRKKKLWEAAGLHFKPSFNPLTFRRLIQGLDLKRLRDNVTVPVFSLKYARRGMRELAFNNPAMAMNVFDMQGHLILGHKNVLPRGWSGLRQQAVDRLAEARAAGDAAGAAWLEAVIISCEAVRDFAGRFAELAEREAGQTAEKKRQRELRAIAARCRRVPWLPPRDFREAVQSLWLTQVAAMIAYGMGSIFAVGRIDQYLYPYFARDRRAGRLTDAEARAWLEELLVKFSGGLLMLPFAGKRTGSELGADSNAPTIGGVTPDGRDAVNPLTHLILQAFSNVKAMGNTFTIRLSEKNPPSFWRAALGVYRRTSGAALYNDEQAVPALQACGYSLADARDYGIIGCVEPTSDGNTFGCTSGNDLSFVAALEMALLNGRLRLMGRRIGPATGDPRRFRTFEELLNAFKRQVAFMIGIVAKGANLKDAAYAELFPNPLVSATLHGCLERARDMTNGGADYRFGSISARGLGTAADSLAAIKYFVYDRGVLTMDKLLNLLDRNFAGEETTRAILANKAPKYGEDDERADAVAREIVAFFCREVGAQRTIHGDRFRPGFFSYGMHVLDGMVLGATPDGRRAGEPISNSFSPTNRAGRQGPTAIFRSVAKIDHRPIANGCALNIKLSPAMFNGEEHLEKMIALVRGYFAMGGMEVSPNVVSNEQLRAAQARPDEYRDLVVRVSGYSAFFTDLGRPLQDEIISRTEFGKI